MKLFFLAVLKSTACGCQLKAPLKEGGAPDPHREFPTTPIPSAQHLADSFGILDPVVAALLCHQVCSFRRRLSSHRGFLVCCNYPNWS